MADKKYSEVVGSATIKSKLDGTEKVLVNNADTVTTTANIKEYATERINRSLGAYTERPDVLLTPLETNVAISSDGVKVSKDGWNIAQFEAALGNEYLFKPGETDGSVCVFSELIDKIETRGIDYAYTYDEQGRIATARATYLGETHTYTYTYSESETSTEQNVETCTITSEEGVVFEYLPLTYQTKVGTYQPLTLLNADAELPSDGYCRFVSNFQSRGSIKVVVSYKADVADLTIKVVRDGMTASMCTQLSKVNQKVDEAKESIAKINDTLENAKDYYIAENDETTGNPKFLNGRGDKTFLAEWHPYLIDTTDNTGEVTHPVGQLQDNNYFRFKDGSFAPTVGITEEMRAACDVQLYTNAEHTEKLTLPNGVVVTDSEGEHPFNAVEVYNALGLIKLYDVNGEEVRQLLPWETTETKYTINIGYKDTLYPIDRQKGKSGLVLSGISKKPIVYDGIDAGRFPLLPTAISPCPITTIGNKARNMFYAYGVGDANTKNVKSSDLCNMFMDGRTYPRVNDIGQVNNMKYVRANNAEAQSSVPFAEGGYHATNVFLLCMELFYGTKYLHDNNLFSSGCTSNDPCTNETTWKNNGGVRYKKQGNSDWSYSTFDKSAPFGQTSTMTKYNWSYYLNGYAPKAECMEGQMAASWAEEFGIGENEEFEAYGNKYYYKNIAGVEGLRDGKMNCKVYRLRQGTGQGYKDADTKEDYDIEVVVRISLMHGVNAIGDIFNYEGGGIAIIGTYKPTADGDKLKDSSIDIYLEPNQSKWLYDTTIEKPNLGTFEYEKTYTKLGTQSPLLSDGYIKDRIGFTPLKTANGGGLSTWQCSFAWSNAYWGQKENSRYFLAVRRRGRSYDAVCGFRTVLMHSAASYADTHNGGSAQCRIDASGCN